MRAQIVAVGCFVCAAASAVADTTLTPDPTKSTVTWQGWGTSLCWWGKVFGDRADVADVVFTTKEVDLEGQKLPGLGLNIARYNAGACSWNEVDGRKMVPSKTIFPFRQIEALWLDGKSADPSSPSWNWQADEKQRAMLLMAKERGADKLELFSNSPPWWMCLNDNPSGQAAKDKCNLRPDQFRNFAIYLATIAAQAKDKIGAAFTTVEPFNEPVSGYWVQDGKQEGCYFSPKDQQQLLPLLREELDRRGLKDTPIAASDETSYSQALSSWKAYDTKAKRLVGQVNVHGYEGDKGPRAELRRAVASDRKPLANSEYGDDKHDGLDMGRRIAKDISLMQIVSWCYWQVLDYANNGGWGLLGADMHAGKIGPANAKYFVLAQFSRHIRPGMTILDTGRDDVVAAFDSKDRKLVVVAVNADGARKATKLSLDLSKFGGLSRQASAWVTEPFGSTRHAALPAPVVTNNRVTLVLPPNSVLTCEISGAAKP